MCFPQRQRRPLLMPSLTPSPCALLLSAGIVPYINASILLQLLATAFPSLKKLQREEGPQVGASISHLIDNGLLLLRLMAGTRRDRCTSMSATRQCP